MKLTVSPQRCSLKADTIIALMLNKDELRASNSSIKLVMDYSMGRKQVKRKRRDGKPQKEPAQVVEAGEKELNYESIYGYQDSSDDGDYSGDDRNKRYKKIDGIITELMAQDKEMKEAGKPNSLETRRSNLRKLVPVCDVDLLL
jgi:hypothetical protein